MDKLEKLLNKKPKNIQEIAIWFDELTKIAAENINKEFSPRRLVKGSRLVDPLPTNTRQLSSFRTRIGTMLEYALSTEMDKIIRENNGEDFYLAFAVSHEYPDFYLRDKTLASLWDKILSEGKEIGEYPHIFTTLVIPAKDIVEERDKRLKIAGGKIEGRQVFVPKRGQPENFVPDQGNYGKLWRLIHRSRRKADDLSPAVKRFLEFLKIIDEYSPNNRFK